MKTALQSHGILVIALTNPKRTWEINGVKKKRHAELVAHLREYAQQTRPDKTVAIHAIVIPAETSRSKPTQPQRGRNKNRKEKPPEKRGIKTQPKASKRAPKPT